MMSTWLLVLIVFISDETHVVNKMSVPSQQDCLMLAETLTKEAMSRPQIAEGDVVYRCTEIKEGDPAVAARQIIQELEEGRE